MARFVFGMNQSLDGYVDHMAFGPSPTLFRHFIEQQRELAGSIYGRIMYETMRVWDYDEWEGGRWEGEELEFAEAWRRQPKWVVSRTMTSVGPNATLIGGDVETAVRALKASIDGDIDVCGPTLAQSLGDLGLIDAYQLYIHPFVVGGGKPFFAGPRPPLHLVASEQMDEEVIRLTYVPA
jgi:dihydrofolate reductase